MSSDLGRITISELRRGPDDDDRDNDQRSEPRTDRDDDRDDDRDEIGRASCRERV